MSWATPSSSSEPVTRSAEARTSDHREVVHVIPHRANFGGVDFPEAGQAREGGPLVGVVAKDLAHRPSVTRATLDEGLDPSR